MYVGKGSPLAGLGASNNPFESFMDTTMKLTSQATRTASTLIPGLVPGGTIKASPSTSTTTYEAATAPVASSKAPYFLAGVGVLGLIGLVMFARKKK